MVGTGIFSTPSSIVTSVGSVGAALLMWLIGFVLACCGLSVWLEFGCLYPRSGGEKVYLQTVYPRPKLLSATLFSVYGVLASSAGESFPYLLKMSKTYILITNLAGGCVVFGENITLTFGYVSSDFEKRLVAITTIIGVTLMHSLVPRWGVRIMVHATQHCRIHLLK